MGRTWNLGEWQSQDETKEYAPALTAIGTKATIPIFDEVKATFAAFYPNCYSVFCLVDSDYATNAPPSGLQYDVIGYYSDEQQDFLKLFLAENEGKTNEELLEILQEEFNWTLNLDEVESEFPQRTLYHSRITFSGSGNSATDGVNSLSDPTIAVADSSPEALAAYLAHSFNPENNDNGKNVRKEVEDKIEALQLLEKLQSRKLDVNPKFLEGRHEQGFGTQNDGYLWTLLPEVSSERKLSSKKPRQQRIPDDLAQALNELNSLQEQYHQKWLDIESMRRQLYSQWYYFMKYRGELSYNTINTTSVIPLRTAIAQVGELEFIQNKDEDDIVRTTVSAKALPFGIVSKLNDTYSYEYFSYYVDTIQSAAEGDFSNWGDIKVEFANCGVTISDNAIVTSITDGEAWQIDDQGQTYDVKVEGGIFNIYIPPTNSQIAVQVTNAIHNLSDAIAANNETKLATKYNLIPFTSQNYWRANEPAVLLTGDAAKAPLRFGQDGRLNEDDYLECQPIDFDVSTIIDNLEQLEEQIDSLQPQGGEESINFISWNEQPWNPFAFHWSVLFYPCRDMVSGEIQDYQPNQILDNYSLEPNAIDLQLKEGREESFVENANTYTGFSLLSPSVGSDLSERIIYLKCRKRTPVIIFGSENPLKFNGR